MNLQNIIAFGVVALSALYLLRNLYHSVRSALKKEAGCSAGCGKCPASQTASRPKSTSQRISLSEVRTIPRNPK